MLPNHSISQTSAGSKEEARGGAGVQGSSSLSPCCRKGSFFPTPNDWTWFGCSASMTEQTRFDLPFPARKDICPQPANTGTHRGHLSQDISTRVWLCAWAVCDQCWACPPWQSRWPCCSAAPCTQPIPVVRGAPQGTQSLAAARAVPGSPNASSSYEHIQNRSRKVLGTDAAKHPLQHSSSTF